MRRGPYAKVAARNAKLLERIRALKADHPFWGYRRIWAYLRYVDGVTVNQKRVYGVMKANDLLVNPNLKLRARRKVDTKKPRPDRLNHWWGIDMTKVMIDGFGWVYLVVVLDWHTKKVLATTPVCRPAPGTGWSPSTVPSTASSRTASRAGAST
jgi:putative transposase